MNHNITPAYVIIMIRLDITNKGTQKHISIVRIQRLNYYFTGEMWNSNQSELWINYNLNTDWKYKENGWKPQKKSN